MQRSPANYLPHSEFQVLTGHGKYSFFRSAVIEPSNNFHAFRVGTGGSHSLAYLIERGSKGYSLGDSHIIFSNLKSTSLQEVINYVRETLNLSVTDMAKAFGVSRQALYDWQAGKNVADSNLLLLSQLEQACRILKEHQVEITPRLLKRKLKTGFTFLESVSKREAIPATYALIDLITSEANELAKLNARFRNRVKSDSEVFKNSENLISEERNHC
jgi:DNA-binding XRE family transcriptional regulator